MSKYEFDYFEVRICNAFFFVYLISGLLIGGVHGWFVPEANGLFVPVFLGALIGAGLGVFGWIITESAEIYSKDSND